MYHISHVILGITIIKMCITHHIKNSGNSCHVYIVVSTCQNHHHMFQLHLGSLFISLKDDINSFKHTATTYYLLQLVTLPETGELVYNIILSWKPCDCFCAHTGQCCGSSQTDWRIWKHSCWSNHCNQSQSHVHTS